MVQSILNEQLKLFLYSIALGGFFGVYYDIFRFLREFGFNSDISVIIQDLIFTVSISIPTFLFFAGFNNGNIRLFCLLAALIGFLIYRFTVGLVTIRILRLILKPLKFLKRLIIKPFAILEIVLLKKLNTAREKAKKASAQNKIKKAEKKRQKCEQTLVNGKKASSNYAEGCFFMQCYRAAAPMMPASLPSFATSSLGIAPSLPPKQFFSM